MLVFDQNITLHHHLHKRAHVSQGSGQPQRLHGSYPTKRNAVS
jgi:hypothetical protein